MDEMIAVTDIRFQSAPVIANGRIAQRQGRPRSDGQVSIHARYC